MAVRDTDPRSDAPDALEETEAEVDDHLADLPDGCGCAEVWAHLSGHRE
ncbi:MAG: hypothetical protein V5A62_07245 [Haloarculaceae archaeon]